MGQGSSLIPFKEGKEGLKKAVQYDSDGNVVSCLFCSIARGEEKEKLIYEDDTVVAFHPLDISAQQHILVVPKQHIRNVDSVEPQDGDLLSHMYQVGDQILRRNAPGPVLNRGLSYPRVFSHLFHVPPYNSVDHLHMHCMEMPLLKPIHVFKYAAFAPWCKTYEKLAAQLAKAELSANDRSA
ncbi:unnamed protein product [Chrysoparadoxa australica]